MYVGHLAIGLAIKARCPDVPGLPIMMGVGLLDILDGLFIIAGLDRVSPNLHSGPYLFFDLTFIDWDHSVLMAVLWALLWAALFLEHKQVAVVAGLSAFSHIVADWPVHNDDLAVFPHSAAHVGLGLWGTLGTASWVLEGLFAAALAAYAWRANAARGIKLLWPCVILVLLFFQMSPWLSPMRVVATVREPATHLVHGVLVTLGFLLPGLLLTWLLSRSKRSAPAAGVDDRRGGEHAE